MSLVVSTFGMEVDVCSGPLPPQEGLALLLGFAGQAAGHGVPSRDAQWGDSRTPSAVERGEGGPQPQSSVSVADWPAPGLVVKCRQQARRNVTLAPGAVEAPPVLFARAETSHVQKPLALRFQAPDHLSRLNC